MSKPRVSIMIPTYNRAHYLSDAIESSLAQDYENLEVIVSDNASLDNTRDIVKKYLDDRRFKYFRNETNIGLFPNWIRLLYEYASGDYGIFLPDDDYFINAKHVTEAVSIIEKYQVNYVITDSIFNDEVRGIKKEVDFDIPEYLTVDWAVENIARHFKDNVSFSPGLPSLFNIKKAIELNALYPQIAGSEGELGLRLMLDGPSAYMKSPQRYGRGHRASAGNTETVENILAGLTIYDRMIEFGRERNLDYKKLIKFKRRNVLLWVQSIVLPAYFNAYGDSYVKYCIFMHKHKNKYKIDLINYIMMILSNQIIGRFVFQKNKMIYKYLRNIYWIIKYGKKYPREFESELTHLKAEHL